jgi:tRNA nucleotidyltransferase (CCA-adding enzyme)
MIDLRARMGKLFPPACHDRVFLVGGCVRDHLLGRPSRDIDLVAAVEGELLSAAGFRLVTGKSTAPIWFRHDDEIGVIELTPLANLEALDSDLRRRDFTINSLAMDLGGNLHDPLGGAGDISRGLLHPCSSDSFREDPLRIFRAFRFEADAWRMTGECEGLIREREWSDDLARIPMERFSREMLKACSAPKPERFFLAMLEFSVGAGYLPELFRMPRIPAGPLEHHPEGNLLAHSVQVLERVARRSDDPLARFCAFFHDIGKLVTDPACYPRHHGHDRAGAALARDLCTRLRLSARYRTALAGISRLHMTFNKWDELRDGTRVRTAEQAVKGGIAEILPLVSAADRAESEEPAGWSRAVGVVCMTTVELGMDQRRLETMLPDIRADLILQKRIEMFRAPPTPPSCA